MANQDIDKSFLGKGWGFPPEFRGRSKEPRMVSEDQDIRESLLILLSTRPGERVMHPTYGCGIHDMVFENVNESTITELVSGVERAILFFEPRITVERIEVDRSGVDGSGILDGILRILIDYTVRTTNTRNNIVFPFYLREGTSTGYLMGGLQDVMGEKP